EEKAEQLMLSGNGKHMMDEIRKLISSMEDDENRLLVVRVAESGKSQRDALLTFAIANLIAVVLLIVIATLVIAAIRARRVAEDALSESHHLLQVTLSSIADAVIVCGTNGRVKFLNPAAEHLTGWRADEAEAQPLQEVFKIVNEESRQNV